MTALVDFTGVDSSITPADLLKSAMTYLWLYKGYILLVLAVLFAPQLLDFLSYLLRHVRASRWDLSFDLPSMPRRRKDDDGYYQLFSGGAGGDIEDEQTRVSRKIKRASRSPVEGIRFNSGVAKEIREYVVDFEKKVFVGNRIMGDVDIETNRHIIEVTMGESSKSAGEFDKYFSLEFNPQGKKVLLYAPNLEQKRVAAIRDKGVIVISDMGTLKNILKQGSD